jgi:uncharacterized repeat protein (TIGR01451 family)
MKKRMLFLLAFISIILPSAGLASAQEPFQPAGYQSYYVLGDSRMVVTEAFDAALELDPSLAMPYGVFSIASSQDASLVYVDQKHNGYTFDPNTFTGYDAVFMLDKGAVLTLDNWAYPYWGITPGGMGHLVNGSLSPVDGGDYVFAAGGPVNVVRGISDRQPITDDGITLTEMTEVYPVEQGGEEGGRFFVLPVGENTPITGDFDGSLYSDYRGGTYAIVQSYSDDTVITYTLRGAAQPPVTLGRGESMVIQHAYQYDTISSSKKIQVVLFGSGGWNYDTRFFNLPDTQHGGNDYWIPTFPPGLNATQTIRFHIFAFTDARVTIESAAGAFPGWGGRLIPAMTNDVSFTTNGTVPLHIYAGAGESFMVLVSLDTNSSKYDWGYVPKDSSEYAKSYFIPYAPSGLGHYYDMQLFVLPLYDETTIYVDYDQDGIADDSRTLDRFEAYGFFNPSAYYLTGTHIYSDFPFTVVYGESPQAFEGWEAGPPGYDWGYTILPFDFATFKSAISMTKAASLPVVNASGAVNYTLTIESGDYMVLGVDAFDLLPPGFSYVPGSTAVAYPNGSVTHGDPEVNGQLLSWHLNETMPGNSSIFVTFGAIASSAAGYYENLAYVTATDPWSNTLTSESREYLTVSGDGTVMGYVTDSTGGLVHLPVPGAAVSLFRSTGALVGTAVTDGNGLYKFVTVPEGTYYVAYDPADPDLANLLPLSDSDPDDPAGSPITSSANFTLSAAETKMHNFNLTRPSSVSGRVFADWNLDGAMGPGDTPLQGETVRLLQNGSVIATAATLADGSYGFDRLMPGEYAVAIAALELYPYRPSSDTDGGAPTEGAMTLAAGSAAEHSFALALLVAEIDISKDLQADNDGYSSDEGIFYGDMVFKITVNNTGNATLAKVRLSDSFNSTAFSFVTASPYPDSVDGINGVLVWGDLTSGGTLVPGESMTIFVGLSAVAVFPYDTMMNIAQATADDEGHAVSDSASVSSGTAGGGNGTGGCSCFDIWDITSRFASITVPNGNSTLDALKQPLARVYSGSNVTVNYTFNNFGCTDTTFDFRVLLYIGGTLFHNASIHSDERFWTHSGSIDVGAVNETSPTDYRMELYRLQDGHTALQDNRTFTIRGILPALGEVDAPWLMVESGFPGEAWTITITNTGNDEVYNVSVAMPDLPGLLIDPASGFIGVLRPHSSATMVFMVSAPEGAEPGERRFNLTFAFGDSLGASHSHAEEASISVDPLATVITLEPGYYVTKKDNSVTLVARLVDANGEPVVGEEVTFFVSSRQASSCDCSSPYMYAITNSSGFATRTYIEYLAGTHNMSAFFGGRGNLAPSNTANGTVTALKLVTSLNVSAPPSAFPGSNVTLSAVLTDENGKKVTYALVTFQRLNGTSWVDVGDASTDWRGTASISVTVPAGESVYGAVFPGTSDYLPSSYMGASVSAVDNTWIYAMLIAALALVSTFLILCALKRRKRQESVAGGTQQ